MISWENSYKKIANNQLFGQAGIHLKQHQLSAEVLLETINNFIYYNQTNTINQANTLVSLLRTQFSYGLNQKYFGVNAKHGITKLIQFSKCCQDQIRPLA